MNKRFQNFVFDLSSFISSVRKSDKVSHVDAACGIGDAIKAYTALFYQAKVASGETVLIADACTVSMILCRTISFFVYFI